MTEALRPRLSRVAFGVCAGLMIAELLVRALGLAPEGVAPPRTLENPDKTYALDCYPSDFVGDVDLRDSGQRAAARSRGLTSRQLDEAAATPRCVPFEYNAHTRRAAPFEIASSPTILVLGDSFTEGAGVALEDTFVVRLQDAMARKARAPRVLNAGRRGMDQPELAESLPRLLALTAPQVVVYALTLNDFEQDPAWAAKQQFLNDLILDRLHMGRPTWKLPGPLSRSAFLRLIAERIRARRAAAETLDWYRGMSGPKNAGGWARTLDDIAAMHTASEAAGARFVLVVLPLLTGLRNAESYPFTALHAELIAACRDRGIEAVDLLPAFLGHDERELWVHRVDMHPNAAGHALIAGALEPLLSAGYQQSP
jgi:lysophospholipase L1-like esterase